MQKHKSNDEFVAVDDDFVEVDYSDESRFIAVNPEDIIVLKDGLKATDVIRVLLDKYGEKIHGNKRENLIPWMEKHKRQLNSKYVPYKMREVRRFMNEFFPDNYYVYRQ